MFTKIKNWLEGETVSVPKYLSGKGKGNETESNKLTESINNICKEENVIEELHWFCSESGHREASVYYQGGHWNEYMVKMVEVELSGKGGVHDIHRTKEIRPMGTHSERYAEDCAENWVKDII